MGISRKSHSSICLTYCLWRFPGRLQVVLTNRLCFQDLKEDEKLGIVSLVVAGGAAGMLFWGPVYPADILKSKIQVDSFTHPEYSGMLDCARKVSCFSLPTLTFPFFLPEVTNE